MNDKAIVLYLTRIPTPDGTIVQEDFEHLNQLMLNALMDIIYRGKVSKLIKTTCEKSIKFEQTKEFCRRTFQWLEYRGTEPLVKKNMKDFGAFFSGIGVALGTFLNEENKILNWPLVAQTLSDPKYDFSNSNLMEGLMKEADRLNKIYNQSKESREY